MTTFCLLIGSGCFLQPITLIQREVHFIGYDATAMRLGKSVKGELWKKNLEKGEWELVGEGDIPAGTLLKFEKPRTDIRDILKEEKNGTSD
jgi:hypothetical protein